MYYSIAKIQLECVNMPLRLFSDVNANPIFNLKNHLHDYSLCRRDRFQAVVLYRHLVVHYYTVGFETF